MKGEIFVENVSTPENGEWISDFVTVSADQEARFITIETDSEEGVAMFTLPAARLVYAALGRAIAACDEKRETPTITNCPSCGYPDKAKGGPFKGIYTSGKLCNLCGFVEETS